jgi:predicted dehydrogenase
MLVARNVPARRMETMATTRRRFIQLAAAGSLVAGGAVSTAHAQEKKPLKLGVIGVGWYGMVDARAALKDGGVEVTALCDVDSDHLEKAAAALEKLQGTRPKTYKLHKDLLGHAGLDAVIIGTPPQWHALQLIDALDKGLDVYLEKPVSYDVREGRAMVDAVKGSDRIVQVGLQRRQSAAFQQAAEYIRSGKLGKVVQVDVQIHYKVWPKDPTPKDPPSTLDWDLWCGPAPKLPYSEQIGHKSWRLEKTTGHGHLVDWGIHNIDAVRHALGLGAPKRITADGGIYRLGDVITTPDTLTVHFEFDQCPVVWRHRLWGAAEYAPETANGVFFYCEKGTVFAADRKWVVVRKEGKETKKEEFKAAADMGTLHMAEFLASVRTRDPAPCSIEDGYLTTATVQLGMIAYESASVVKWDAKSEQIPDNPAAAALLKRDYRAPWNHPYNA